MRHLMVRIKRSRLYAKAWWAVKQLRCRHTHTFSITPTYEWQSEGKRMPDKHRGIKLEGCYLCGKVWCRDDMGPNGPTREPI